jgi:hypothetical protein
MTPKNVNCDGSNRVFKNSNIYECINKELYGQYMQHARGKLNMHTKLWSENVKRRENKSKVTWNGHAA